jgi:polysaccharide pyruvyl transferase CsaB
MGHILICGAAGYTNLGDDAILWGMARELAGLLRGRRLAVVGGPALPDVVAPLGAGAIPYEDREAVARAIEEADLVVLGGGGLLYDVEYEAGLVRLLADPPDRRWLYEMAKLATAARAARKPAMLYGVGAGPLVTDSAQQMARFLVEHVDAVTVRDEASASLLRECGAPRTRVHVAADPAVSVEPGDAETAEAFLAGVGLDTGRPRVAVNVRPWGPATGDEAFVAQMGEVVGELTGRLGSQVALLPFQRMNDDDRALLARILEAAGEPAGAVLIDPQTRPPELAAVIGRFDVMVGMRLHTLVLATAAGTPFVALPYQEKVREFAADVGLGEHAHAAEGIEAGAVVASCEALLGERESAEARAREERDRLRARSAISAKLAATLLGQGVEGKRVVATPRTVPSKPTGRTLRVLMQIRSDFREKPGGDVVQLEELLPPLAEAGVTAELTGEGRPDLDDWDLVHTINLDRPDDPYHHALHARAQGKPVALSPVHNDMSELWEWGDPDYWDLPPPEEGAPRSQRSPAPDEIESRRRALADVMRKLAIDAATVYLPNSHVDADYLAATYGMDLSRTIVVHHGVREMFFEARPEPFVEKYGLADFVLCGAARVERRKNQLSLVAAMRGSGIPLVIVGQPNPEGYRDLCQRYADENTLFIDAMPQEELASAYAAAKVHALPSWFEVPGLVSLEAGAAGCNIVSTDRGSAREYLEEMAWYCDPRSVESVREAVQAAYEAPRSERLREHIQEHFTWRQAAEQTVEGYRLAMSLYEATGDEERRARELVVARQHADFLARLAEDRGYEAKRMREWAEAADAELRKLQEEFGRMTSRRLHRWSAGLARAGWGLLRVLGVKQ